MTAVAVLTRIREVIAKEQPVIECGSCGHKYFFGLKGLVRLPVGFLLNLIGYVELASICPNCHHTTRINPNVESVLVTTDYVEAIP
jgi:hypothetical protein